MYVVYKKGISSLAPRFSAMTLHMFLQQLYKELNVNMYQISKMI